MQKLKSPGRFQKGKLSKIQGRVPRGSGIRQNPRKQRSCPENRGIAEG